ncbi:MAG: helix-turn-helix domain-containing protein [Candidatus Thorarchaeota archaeon]
MSLNKSLEGLFSEAFERPSDFLCCAFGLRKSEIDVYFALLTGPKTVEELATDESIERDRSTVQRVLTKLLDKGLVIREEKHLERGGYYYLYRAISEEAMKREILKQLDNWYQQTRSFLLNEWPEISE